MKDKKDDDDISIDLSKITGFFKRKKEDEKHNVHAEIGGKAAEARQEEQKTEDDEISIDFSKIKNIFKAKKTGAHEDKKQEYLKAGKMHAEGQKDDDEVSLDFSKIKNIKNIFRKDEKTAADEDIAIDIRKIGNFFVRHRILLLILIPIFLSIFLRGEGGFTVDNRPVGG